MTSIPSNRSRIVRRVAAVALVGAALVAAVVPFRSWQRARSVDHLRENAFAAVARGDHREALLLLDQYLEQHPGDAEARVARVRALDATLTGEKGRVRAFLALEESLRDDPSRDDLRRRTIEVALEIRRPTDALRHLDALSGRQPRDAWSLHQSARAHEMLGDLLAAVADCREALALDPHHLDAGERLVSLLARLDRRDDATAAADALVAANPDQPRPLLLRAKRRADLNQWGIASADYAAAIELAPKDTAPLLAAGRFQLRRAQFDRTMPKTDPRTHLDEARRLAILGTELAPANGDFPLLLADVEATAGSPDAAIRHLQVGREHNPSDVRLQVRLADRLLAAGRIAEAGALIESLPKNDAVRPLRRYLTARRHMVAGEFRPAHDELERAIRDSAAVPQLSEYLALPFAECCRALGLDDEEAAAWRRVLRAHPTSEPARLGLAAIAVRQERLGDAIAEYRQLTHVPEVVPALVRLLLRRDRALPPAARDWTEIDELLAKLDGLPINVAVRKETRELIKADRSSDESFALIPTSDGDVSDSAMEAAGQEATSSDESIAALGVELATLRPLIAAGRCDEAVGRLRNFARPSGDRDMIDIERPMLASLAAHQLAREGRRSATTDADACARQFASASADFLKAALESRPDQLLIVAAFLAANDDRRVESNDSAADWRTFVVLAASDPSLVVPGCGRLSAATTLQLDAAVRTAEPSAILYCGAGDLHSLRGDYPLAEQWYAAALQREPDHALALNNLAWLFALQRKNLDEARTLIDRALRSAGPEPRLRDTRGCLLLATGQPREALREFETSLREDPGPVAALHLAAARLALEDRTGAADAVRLVIREGVSEDRLHPLERERFQMLRRQLASELVLPR